MLITIIIPAYNAAAFIKDTLQSCVNQSYHDIDILFVDDGSTDNSKHIVDTFIEDDSRVRYLRQDNVGLVEARRTGVRNVMGDFFIFLDADDILETDAIESLVNEQVKGDYDIVFSNFHVITDSGNSLKYPNGKYLYGLSKYGMINNILSRNVAPPLWGRLLRKRVFSLSNVPSYMTIGEDAIAWLQILSSEEDLKISEIDNKTIYYIQRGGSMVNVKSSKKNNQRMAFIKWVSDFISSKYEDEIVRQNLAVFISSELFTYLRDGGNCVEAGSIYNTFYTPNKKLIKKNIGIPRYLMIDLLYTCPMLGKIYRSVFNMIRKYKYR